MKRLFSKKSGFTLVEIILAFAVFALMASMLVQVLNLTITQKTSNIKYEQYLQGQENTLYSKDKITTWDETVGKNGDLDLAFVDPDGNDLGMTLEYQWKAADGTAGDPAGLNYFVGQLDYDGEKGNSSYTPGEGADGSESDPSQAGGSSQMSRFDTRLTGTKGISSIVLIATPTNATKDEYEIKITVNDSSVDPTMKGHSQVSMFFGEGGSGGTMAKVESIIINGVATNNDLHIKKTGLNGVNVHCRDYTNGFNGSTETFIVKFTAPINNLGFGSGDNISGNTYTNMDGYPNIYGAYEKTTS